MSGVMTSYANFLSSHCTQKRRENSSDSKSMSEPPIASQNFFPKVSGAKVKLCPSMGIVAATTAL